MATRAAAVHRRVLHQPLFPTAADSPPPPQTSGDDQSSPFFPNYPSPPPPPSPSAFASFPVNISSLPIPHSSPSHSINAVSPALVALTIALSLCALAVAASSLFLFLRSRRNRRYSTDDDHEKPAALPPPPVKKKNTNINNNTNTNSAEFLYLGTMVSSGAVDNGGEVRLEPRKIGSPDLNPLPPLARQSLRRSVGEEEDESFYSPRGSVSGHESSVAPVNEEQRNYNKTRSESNSSSESSSSENCSPARSRSLSTKSPETTPSPKMPAISLSRSPPPETYSSASPERELKTKAEEEAEVSPLLSNASSSSGSSSPAGSPRLSPLWPLRGKFSPSRDLSIFDRSQLSPASDSSNSSAKSPSSKLTRFINRGSKKNSPESSRITNSTPSSPHSTASPISSSNSSPSRSSSPKILNSPRRSSAPPPPPPPPPPRTVIRSESPIKPTPIPDLETAIAEKTKEDDAIDATPKPKLKPLHWDKVRASSGREMVWDQMRSSSFELNEEMIETLFVVNNPASKIKEASPNPAEPSPRQEERVLDPNKARNVAISLRALNVTVDEVREALLEGNPESLGTELLESLLKMAPTEEEEWKLREYKEDSPCKLDHAERFLKTLVDIPFAFKRIESMLYMANFDSEVEYLKKSFETLEAACDELRNSRMFLKLLEAVLKTGNRMNVGTNRGDAHAFKLDTLLKLVDVKGADGKTTLLHFVVQEIIRIEGTRLSNDEAKSRKLGLQVVSCLASELANVKKAAAMDSDALNTDVGKLSIGLANVVSLNESLGPLEPSRRFSESTNKFIRVAEEEIIRVQAQESVALSLVKEITEYFHGDSAREEAHPFRTFTVVRDFLAILDRVCKEVGSMEARTVVVSAHRFPIPVNPTLPAGLTGFQWRRNSSSSDGESS